MSISKQNARWIKAHALRAISSNRAPGMHFPGYFMRLKNERYQTDGVALAVEPGPHCMNNDGVINRAALLFVVDMVLAAANRVHTSPDMRTATLMMRVDFTGAPARGRITGTGVGRGFSARTALPESTCTGALLCDGREVIRCSGVWVSPPAPKGVVMAGLPWEGGEDGTQRPQLKTSELEPNEKEAQIGRAHV